MQPSLMARAAALFCRVYLKRPLMGKRLDVPLARRRLEAPGQLPAFLPRGLRVERSTEPLLKGEWLIPEDTAPNRTLLYLHGGGYFACTPQTYRPVTSSYALAGFKTFAPDYRLAPEHPFPAGIEDAIAAYRGLLESHAPQQIVVSGDSAGGGLCMALLLSLRERGIPMPAAAVLFSPFVDLAATGESARINSARCAMFDSESFGRAAGYYVGQGDRRAPLASPLYADLRGMPPLLIHVGADETLLDDSRRLAESAQRAGVKVELKVWPVVPHVWQLFQQWIPEGRSSLREAGMFFAREVNVAAVPASNG